MFRGSDHTRHAGLGKVVGAEIVAGAALVAAVGRTWAYGAAVDVVTSTRE